MPGWRVPSPHDADLPGHELVLADADTLGDVETDVLGELNPPLNLVKVKRDPLRLQLSALRKKYGRRGPAAATASD